MDVFLRSGSHGVPNSKSQYTLGQYVQSQLLIAWKLELPTLDGVPSLKSQVWHGCLHGNTFRGVDWDLYWDLGQEKS